ncbi:RNA polymerase sigma factor [Microbacterium terricola]|uniref:DNA-directed RNA polymerase sigma-70 factor n=1 Tax=Microbacterium terricola TaxID=344163 RepID=A0ABM8DVL3_9MICO|nr:sigma-70 family RNA polymerase sigma factor [Microbacterium terricola]UYK39605.1 sigma-70 family RNA polymerase sigma factor [Microbacterium terricola]BDV29655.1 DNA-directed RNA polymerase sigma-70 factor [Microbacterium terricola]
MTEPDSPHLRDPSEDDGVADAAPSIWERAAEDFHRWQGGDARAMDDLVRLMTPVLWHVVRAYGLDTMLAEDVVQSTWLTLVRRHDSIADERAVAGWLTTTARREAWRVGRAHQRVRPTETPDLEPHLPVEDSAEDRAQHRDRDRRLWGAVGVLDERCRRLLRIVAFEERPDYARIALDLAMPVGSIGPTRQRCLSKLRTALEADGWRGETRDL